MPEKPLANRRVLTFVDDVYEDLELWYPKYRLQEAGAEVVIAAHELGKVYHGKHGYPCRSEAVISDMRSADFDAVLLPGGFMPDKLRRDSHLLQLIREFHRDGKLIAAICHGGWMAISAGVYKGVRVTGSPGIKDDLTNAGAEWVDAAAVVDRHFVSSRRPDDLPDFCLAIIDVLTGQSRRGEPAPAVKDSAPPVSEDPRPAEVAAALGDGSAEDESGMPTSDGSNGSAMEGKGSKKKKKKKRNS